MKKKLLTLKQAKTFLSKKGLIIINRNNFFLNSEFKNFYFTVLCSFFIVLSFITLLIIIEFN